jgi:arginine exporter protein ArgO
VHFSVIVIGLYVGIRRGKNDFLRSLLFSCAAAIARMCALISVLWFSYLSTAAADISHQKNDQVALQKVARLTEYLTVLRAGARK